MKDPPARSNPIKPFKTLLPGWIFPLILALGGCGGGEIIREYFRDPTPHEAYVLKLTQMGLDSTGIGGDWLHAAKSALDASLSISLPYLEEGFFAEETPSALGYRFELLRGQQLSVTVELSGRDSTVLFVDLYRSAPDSARAPAFILSGSVGSELVYEPRRDGDYLLRIQPELLRGGRFRVTIRSGPTLEFPVSGHDSRAIRSFFGASREGGRRRHHGVDIFAPRGTPVIAATDGVVRRADTTGIGGRVVWLRDSNRRQSLYYAHLETILAPTGTQVRTGDTLGLVGNTGNARTTPPHLHFGIYSRGPIDPWNHVHKPPGQIQEITGDADVIGSWARVRADESALRVSPSRQAEILSALPRHTPFRVIGGVGSWFRVLLPDGSSGFLAGAVTEGLHEPIRTETAYREVELQSDPLPEAPIMAEVSQGSTLSVLGTFNGFWYVQAPGGKPAWVAAGR